MHILTSPEHSAIMAGLLLLQENIVRGTGPDPSDDQTFQPLEDTKAVRSIRSERDPRLVPSVIEDPGGDEDAYLYVPGYWRRADGWHLTMIAWDPNDKVIGAFRCGERE